MVTKNHFKQRTMDILEQHEIWKIRYRIWMFEHILKREADNIARNPYEWNTQGSNRTRGRSKITLDYIGNWENLEMGSRIWQGIESAGMLLSKSYAFQRIKLLLVLLLLTCSCL